jgi:hypothetical protein
MNVKRFVCPHCRQRTGVSILYGMPTDEAFRAAELGQIALGGCCIEEDTPERRCLACSHEWQIPHRT